MFNIFSSKKTHFPFGKQLKVDMHSHILPGIDDGAPDIESSLILVDGLIRSGYEKLIATPHVMSDHWPNTPETINDALSKLQAALKERGYSISVEAAAEYMLDENFENLLKEDHLLTMGDRMVLVETYFQFLPPNFNDIIFQLQLKKYKIILAHPERYHFTDDAFLQKMKEAGVYLQANVLSFTGYYGKKEKQQAERMLDAGLIDFLGTDVHHMRHLNALENNKISRKIIDKLSYITNHGI